MSRGFVGLGTDGLNHDGLGELLGDAEAGVADLTDEIGVAADEFDLLIFAKTHFAQTAADFGGGFQLLDTDSATGLHLT